MKSMLHLPLFLCVLPLLSMIACTGVKSPATQGAGQVVSEESATLYETLGLQVESVRINPVMSFYKSPARKVGQTRIEISGKPIKGDVTLFRLTFTPASDSQKSPPVYSPEGKMVEAQVDLEGLPGWIAALTAANPQTPARIYYLQSPINRWITLNRTINTL